MEGFTTPVFPGCRWLHEHHSADSKINFQPTVGELDLALDGTEFGNCSMLNLQKLPY